MADLELIAQLNNAAIKVGCVGVLTEAQSLPHIERLAKLYVSESAALLWWEVLKVPVRRINYAASDELLPLVALTTGQKECILVVTDEEHPPWQIYEGSAEKLIEVIKDCRHFEFILAASNSDWAIFDTHMNDLLVVGRLMAETGRMPDNKT